MSGQDGGWEQFDTTCSRISAPQWHHTPRSGHAALLVCPSGTIHPVVDCHEFT